MDINGKENLLRQLNQHGTISQLVTKTETEKTLLRTCQQRKERVNYKKSSGIQSPSTVCMIADHYSGDPGKLELCSAVSGASQVALVVKNPPATARDLRDEV